MRRTNLFLNPDERRQIKRVMEGRARLEQDKPIEGMTVEQVLSGYAKSRGLEVESHKYGLDLKTWELIEV